MCIYIYMHEFPVDCPLKQYRIWLVFVLVILAPGIWSPKGLYVASKYGNRGRTNQHGDLTIICAAIWLILIIWGFLSMWIDLENWRHYLPIYSNWIIDLGVTGDGGFIPQMQILEPTLVIYSTVIYHQNRGYPIFREPNFIISINGVW